MTAQPPPTPDVIDIEGLSVHTVIGIFEHERTRKQEVVVHLRLETDARVAAKHDTIDHALDYKAVAKRVIALVEDSSFHLIETMADRIASALLAEFPTPRVTVRVEKPGALRYVRNVSITITREC